MNAEPQRGVQVAGAVPHLPLWSRVWLEPPHKSGVAAACTIPLCLETWGPTSQHAAGNCGNSAGSVSFPPRFWWVSERGNRSRWWGGSRAGVVTERTRTSWRWRGLGAIECPGRFVSSRENRTVVKGQGSPGRVSQPDPTSKAGSVLGTWLAWLCRFGGGRVQLGQGLRVESEAD